MNKTNWLRSLALATLALLGAPANAAGPRLDIFDIALGSSIAELPAGFREAACGTNGGPPSIKLADFAAFATCPPEKSGLHEVYFRYDDRQEYVARALEQSLDIARFGGTQAYDFPVIASVLVDDDGVIRGKRLVSDPRPGSATNRPRYEFWTLGNLLRHQFGGDWNCVQLDNTGIQPVGTFLVNTECRLADDTAEIRIEQRYFRKRGQDFQTPGTRAFQPNAFESTTRFEQMLPDPETAAKG
jgi:hypothetical protein